ncbi:unnamed protein product [Acanthoscelides obtectus]|uniref:Ankyrin repeat domain-containing protein 16-like n=1 Tax=Acanthoscelides obtectus TaxID=200917 RepID=A0A9P0PMG8_ACAOB|nr:unnamed protein product [Acanthoscelides obtectus]CAK1620192.1 Ankyrin repeat domain-containing protein 16 [Acanthoscelides obtectus]
MCSKNDFLRVLKAAQNGNTKFIVEFFFSHKIHWTELNYDQTGDTLIHCAARHGFVDIIDFLLTQFSPKSVDCKNKDGKTALHEAAQNSNHLICERLLKHGADVNALKKADWTPLMLACTKTDLEDTTKTVQVLLNHGALVNCKNKDGWTCFHLIAREGNIEILKVLIEHGLYITEKTRNGRTGLHIAALHGHLAVVILLLDLGLEVDDRDNCGSTVLHEAVSGGHIDVCKELIQRKTNQYVRNNADCNLLHLAASEGHLEIITFLVDDLKFDVNCTNRYGLTPLHCAARKSQVNVYKHLLNLGSNYDAVDNFGRIPNDYFPKMN